MAVNETKANRTNEGVFYVAKVWKLQLTI